MAGHFLDRPCISDKIDFKTKAIVRDKQGHYIIIKRTIQQEYITLVNVYVPNVRAPKYVKKILLDIKREVDRLQSVGAF